MSNVDHPFEDFRFDFISHLSARFGLPRDTVTARLGEWLLDAKHDNGAWQLELSLCQPVTGDGRYEQ